MLKELETLEKSISHIAEIVSLQQSYAKVSSVNEELSPQELFADALRVETDSLELRGIEIIYEYEDVPSLPMDRHKIVQILVNLIANAKAALSEHHGTGGTLTLRLFMPNDDYVHFEVADDGIGMSPDTLKNIFVFGFTTKQDGHGFGLHTSALAAKEMGGELSVQSEGEGLGATFVLEVSAHQDIAAEATV